MSHISFERVAHATYFDNKQASRWGKTLRSWWKTVAALLYKANPLGTLDPQKLTTRQVQWLSKSTAAKLDPTKVKKNQLRKLTKVHVLALRDKFNAQVIPKLSCEALYILSKEANFKDNFLPHLTSSQWIALYCLAHQEKNEALKNLLLQNNQADQASLQHVQKHLKPIYDEIRCEEPFVLLDVMNNKTFSVDQEKTLIQGLYHADAQTRDRFFQEVPFSEEQKKSLIGTLVHLERYFFSSLFEVNHPQNHEAFQKLFDIVRRFSLSKGFLESLQAKLRCSPVLIGAYILLHIDSPNDLPRFFEHREYHKLTKSAEVLEAIGKITSEQKKALTPQFPPGTLLKLESFIKHELQDGTQLWGRNKQVIFGKAYEYHLKHRCEAKVVGHQLADSKPYQLTATQSPAYFQDVVNLSGRYDFKKGYYAYTGTGSYDVYIDFAANFLGGGALGIGFVQEEIMFATMPNAAEHLLSTSPKPTIRYGDRNVSSPCGGSPSPYLMEGAVRTITVDLYGGSVLRGEKAHRDGTMITKENVGNYVHEVNPPNQGINILAIAAPRLHRNTNPKTLECVKDLFNTAYAGFALAKQRIPTEQQCMIHSGKLGCGAFNNNVKVSILAQLFAAQLHGVDITFYDFKDPERQEMIDLYESITFPPNCTIEQGLQLIYQAVNK